MKIWSYSHTSSFQEEIINILWRCKKFSRTSYSQWTYFCYYLAELQQGTKKMAKPQSLLPCFSLNPRLSILIIYNYLEAVTATPTIRGISSRRFSGIFRIFVDLLLFTFLLMVDFFSHFDFWGNEILWNPPKIRQMRCEFEKNLSKCWVCFDFLARVQQLTVAIWRNFSISSSVEKWQQK